MRTVPPPITDGHSRRRIALAMGALLAAASSVLPASAQSAPSAGRPESMYEGVLGTGAIGMTIVHPRGGETALTGHYFAAGVLKDIPLTGSFQAGRLILREAGGGAFVLAFVDNGFAGGKPLDFGNSIGLTGQWTQGATRLAVTLGSTGSRVAGGRRYAQVTRESDEAFEARVQGFHRAVLAGDRAAAAGHVAFPLRVTSAGKSRQIASAEQLDAEWDRVFTPACLDVLKEALPHDMFVARGQAMIGNGVAWFGANGAVAINLP